MSVRYTQAQREELHAARRSAELKRRAALSVDEAIAEVLQSVVLEADGTVAAWSDGPGSDVVYVTPAELVDTYRVSVRCCRHCKGGA